MISLLISIGFFVAGVALAMWLAMGRVPTGYQDEEGYHEGFEPVERRETLRR